MLLRLVTAFVLTFALAAGAHAQGKTNFSGTWNIDAAKSDPLPPPPPGAPPGAAPRVSKYVITQTATDFTTLATGPRGDINTTYKLNGTETSDQGPMGETIKSKLSWDGARLVITRAGQVQGPQGPFEMRIRDVYSLEGGILFVTSTRNAPMGPEQTRRNAYTKAK